MDEHRKYAYRLLLYYAMLDIRPLAWISLKRDWYKPSNWFFYLRRVKELGALADWLHNLASFSRSDFEGFSEEQFWIEFEWLLSKHPCFECYRSHFQNAMVQSQTGRWPTIEEQQARDAQSNG